jgi:hypothetical protein
VNGDGAYQSEMNEVALFERALRVAVPTRPDPLIARDLVPRLARLAHAATIEAETQASSWGARVAGRRSRLALVARVGIAVALIPLVLAGLAFAGVTVPGPARDAFDSVGITLPNQPSEGHGGKPAVEPKGTQGGGGNDVSDAAKSARQSEQRGNSEAAHEHALQQRSKAKGEAVGHERGKAIGLNEATPPAQSGDTGPPAHSNAGGSTQSQSVPTTPQGESRPDPPEKSLRGQSRGSNVLEVAAQSSNSAYP